MKIYKIALEGLDTNEEKSQAKRDFKEQSRALNQYIKIIPGLVEQIYQNSKDLYAQIVTQIPGRNIGTVLDQRRRAFAKRVDEIQGLQEFYSHVAGEDNKKKVVNLIKDMASDQIIMRDAKKRLIGWATNFFKETTTEEKRSGFDESGYTEKLLTYLPKEVYFDLGPNRELLAIKESFGNKKLTWEIKSQKIAYIAKHINEMFRDIKNDLNSGDEKTKLLALMMGITIQTGLRPGAIGNKAPARDDVTRKEIVDAVTGETIYEDTFGVSTLQPSHIKNIRDGFAELNFKGKMNGIQVATLTDAQIVSSLQQAIASTTLEGDTAMIFTTKAGEHIDDNDMREYVKGKWKDLTPTDFRKYVATKNFYGYVKQATDEFRVKLINELSKDQEELKNTILTGVIEIMDKGIDSVREAISHHESNGKQHDAWQKYVSPKVIMAYLANGGLEDTLEEILIDNKNVKFAFDCQNFVKFAETM